MERFPNHYFVIKDDPELQEWFDSLSDAEQEGMWDQFQRENRNRPMRDLDHAEFLKRKKYLRTNQGTQQ